MERSDSSTCLLRKRNELINLINHIRSRPGHNEDSKVTNVILSRLLAEVHRTEVEEMRNRILDCPGLSSKSPALQAALPVLEEAMAHIKRNSDQHNSCLLSAATLTSTFMEKFSSEDSS